MRKSYRCLIKFSLAFIVRLSSRLHKFIYSFWVIFLIEEKWRFNLNFPLKRCFYFMRINVFRRLIESASLALWWADDIEIVSPRVCGLVKFVNHINKIIVFGWQSKTLLDMKYNKRSKSRRRVHSFVEVHTDSIIVSDLLIEENFHQTVCTKRFLNFTLNKKWITLKPSFVLT